ncbi:hypothetical protein KTD31_01875 [Burkholderia multivorans]|jgi:hypothetical protein|uniref:hypothetical protein n=1 Tax=Burkholderia multivorans TaxID=87883 RepID=UPI001C225A3F|nr:hypothetical protein [Burkholderia multivorans]MBU9200152.1 hypothetical protein [Burkholderia multivorans]MDN8078727.1 hypothetical protein [Burkholderia multivorans]
MTHQLFIPPLGTKLRLVEPWNFSLYNERRNATLMALLGDTRNFEYHDIEGIPATLPVGTILIIDRYYIRQGLGDFDSVSFRMQGVSAEAKTYSFSKATRRQVRFWVKLPDVNTMRVDLIEAEDTRSAA